MARFIPDINKSRVIFASRAEEVFYNECRRSLGSAWRVMYSVTLSSLEGKQGLKDNEFDFVLYHPRYGVFVVEVKGGRIRYDKDANNFFSVNRMGQEFSIKNPFMQVLNAKSRMIRLFKEKNLRVPVTQVVCLPNVNEAELPEAAGIEQALVVGRNRLGSLEQSLKNIVHAVQPEKFLRFDDVGEKIEDVLVGGNFCTKLYIRDYIDTHETRVKDVEAIHDNFIRPIANNKRLGIEGEAGTGKTILAVNLAKYFRDQGGKVLMLSSNETLNHSLRLLVGTDVTIKSYFDLSDEYGFNLQRPSDDFKGTKEDWMQLEAPAYLVKAVAKGKERYDVIICDEAQDVQPLWWEMVQELLNQDNPENRFYVLFDRSQGIFGSGDSESFVPEKVLPVPAPYFPLVNNYRTTREVATFARYFRTGKSILESHTARLGYLPQVITYKDMADAQKKLAALTESLVIQEGLKPEEISLISARRPQQEPSVLQNLKSLANIGLHFLQGGKRGEVKPITVENHMTVTTVAGFKGLESKVGILINFSEYNLPLTHPIMASMMYVAATRAKHLLYIFVLEKDQKLATINAAIRQIKLTGGLVIDQFDPDYEFIGEVTHYNPDRLGWLSVNDPRFPNAKVMFFPSDVEKARLGKIQVGSRVKFRPRVEGEMTIACDLS